MEKAYMILVFGLSTLFVYLTRAHKLVSMSWKFSKEIAIGLILLCAIVLLGSFVGFWKVEDVKQAKPVTQQIVADSIKSTGEFLTKQAKKIEPEQAKGLRSFADWAGGQVMDGAKFVGSGLAHGAGMAVEKLLNNIGFFIVMGLIAYLGLRRAGWIGATAAVKPALEVVPAGSSSQPAADTLLS